MQHYPEEKKPITPKTLQFKDILTNLQNIEKSPDKREQEVATLQALIKQSAYSEQEKTDLLECIASIVQKSKVTTLPSEAKTFQKHFNADTYNSLLQYAKLAYLLEKDGSPEEHAFKLSLFFKNPESALSFLIQFAKKNSPDKTMHDACLFTLPEAKNFSLWKNISKQGSELLNNEFKLLLSHSKEIEKLHKKNSEEAKERKGETKESSKDELEKEYKRCNDLCNAYESNPYSRVVIGEKEYKKALEARKNCQIKLTYHSAQTPLLQLTLKELKNYLSRLQFESSKGVDEYLLKMGIPEEKRILFHSINRSKAGSEMPNIFLDCADAGHPGFYLRKLDVSNNLEDAAMAACLGKLTNCCQSLTGEAGEPCTIHGLKSPKGAFYVLFKGDPKNPKADDPIMAQSWAWLSDKKSLQFDSIEITTPKTSQHHFLLDDRSERPPEENEAIRHIFAYAALQWVMNNQLQQVRMGTSAAFKDFMMTNDPYFVGENQFPADYNEYRESHTQIRLATHQYPEIALCWLPQKLQDVYWDKYFALESKEEKLSENAIEQRKRIIDIYSMIFDNEDKRPLIENLYKKVMLENNPEIIRYQEIVNEYLKSLYNGDIELKELERFKKEGINFDIKGRGFELFQIALRSKNDDVALFLATELKNINFKDRKNKSMLDQAFNANNFKVAKILIERGVPIKEIKTNKIERVVKHCIDNDEKDFLKFLLQKLSPDIIAKMIDRNIIKDIFNLAIKDQDASLLKFIPTTQETTKYLDKMKMDVLYESTNEMNREKMSFLLNNIEDILKVDESKASHYDNSDDDEEESESKDAAPSEELTHPTKLSELVLLVAADNGWNDILEKVINENINLNCVNRDDMTALMSAVSKNHVDCVKTLLKLPHNLDLKTPDGKTVFDMTTNKEILSLLNSFKEHKSEIESKTFKKI